MNWYVEFSSSLEDIDERQMVFLYEVLPFSNITFEFLP